MNYDFVALTEKKIGDLERRTGKVEETVNNWTSATTKHVVNIVDRVCKLENANPIVSEQLKNAILGDFDNIFSQVNNLTDRVLKLEQEPNTVRELEAKLQRADEHTKAAQAANAKLADELNAVLEVKKQWQEEALVSRIKLEKQEQRIGELIHKLDTARQERDHATANEAGQRQNARDWQKEALESRDIKSRLHADIKTLTDEVETLKKANSQLWDHGKSMHDEIELRKREYSKLQNYCTELSIKAYGPK